MRYSHFYDYKAVKCAWPSPAYSTMTLSIKSTPPLFINQIKKRFPIGDPLLEMFGILDPNAQNVCSKYTSLAPLAVAFPNIVLSSKLQILDNGVCLV